MKVQVTSAAKTVADCFKFRNRVGLDVTLEALREDQSRDQCDAPLSGGSRVTAVFPASIHARLLTRAKKRADDFNLQILKEKAKDYPWP